MTYQESKQLLERYLRYHSIQHSIRDHIDPVNYYGGSIDVTIEILGERYHIAKAVQYSRDMYGEHGPATHAMEDIRKRCIRAHIYLIYGYPVEVLERLSANVPDYVHWHATAATDSGFIEALHRSTEVRNWRNEREWQSEMMGNWMPRQAARQGINT